MREKLFYSVSAHNQPLLFIKWRVAILRIAPLDDFLLFLVYHYL